jgi:hypothetical protein
MGLNVLGSVVAAGTALAIISAIPQATAGRSVVGDGVQRCSERVDNPDDLVARPQNAWLLGFASASNLANNEAPDFLLGSNSATFLLRVDAYCVEHPSTKIADGAAIMVPTLLDDATMAHRSVEPHTKSQWGQGNQSCAERYGASDRLIELQDSWALGFLSATNLGLPIDLVVDSDRVRTYIAALGSYCAEHPVHNIATAAMLVSAAMMQEYLDHRSDARRAPPKTRTKSMPPVQLIPPAKPPDQVIR